MEQKKQKSSDGTTLYVRNIPVSVANTIRKQAKEKRQNIAGVIIELVEFARSAKYFDDEKNH